VNKVNVVNKVNRGNKVNGGNEVKDLLRHGVSTSSHSSMLPVALPSASLLPGLSHHPSLQGHHVGRFPATPIRYHGNGHPSIIPSQLGGSLTALGHYQGDGHPTLISSQVGGSSHTLGHYRGDGLPSVMSRLSSIPSYHPLPSLGMQLPMHLPMELPSWGFPPSQSQTQLLQN
jgi:hypothetical protein